MQFHKCTQFYRVNLNGLAYKKESVNLLQNFFIGLAPGVNFMSCQISLSLIPAPNANNFFCR
jgi:hypothetical protein